VVEHVAEVEPAEVDQMVAEEVGAEPEALTEDEASSEEAAEAITEPQAEEQAEEIEEVTAPREAADYLVERPGISTLEEGLPYLEPWLESLQGPIVPETPVQPEVGGLASAGLTAVGAPKRKNGSGYKIAGVDLTPQAFAGTTAKPRVEWAVRAARPLPSAGAVRYEIPARSSDAGVVSMGAESLVFPGGVEFHEPALLKLMPSESSTLQRIPM